MWTTAIAAGVLLLIAGFQAWNDQHNLVLAEVSKNQFPEIKGKVVVVFSTPGEKPNGKIELYDSEIFMFLELMNHRDVPTTISRCELTLAVGDELRTVGEHMFKFPVKISYEADYKDITTTSDGFKNYVTVSPLGLHLSAAMPLRRGVPLTGGFGFT